jgi:zeaxanthin glucosyltransferase
MTTLLVAPDFYSHYRPVGVLGRSLAAAGEEVVVASGPTMRPFVLADGLDWVEIALGPGSNDGVAAADRHDRDDAEALDRFLAATRAGMVATLDHQAVKRRHELLWEPVATGRRLLRLLDDIDPDHIVVDQVSLTSTLSLVASGRPFVTFVPGHPSQLPVGDERYGDALTWPTAFRPDPAALADLHATCRSVTRDATDAFNEALSTLAPTVPPVADAFAVHGDLVAYRWETELHDPVRRPLLPTARVELGPLVDPEPLPPDLVARLAKPGPSTSRPLVYVALGTFLCHRADVLAVIAEALRRAGARAAIAVGPHDPRVIGPAPDDWIVAPRLPQVALLPHADLAISHAGNGSVQEALAHGVRQLLLPFSTDQPAIAADLQRAGLARAADPNTLTADQLNDLVTGALTEPRPAPVGQPDSAALLRAPAAHTS